MATSTRLCSIDLTAVDFHSVCLCGSATTRAAGSPTAPSTSAPTAHRRSRGRSTAPDSPSVARALASFLPTLRTAQHAARASTIRHRRAHRPACLTTGAPSFVLRLANAHPLQLFQAELPQCVCLRVRRVFRERALHLPVQLEGELRCYLLPLILLEQSMPAMFKSIEYACFWVTASQSDEREGVASTSSTALANTSLSVSKVKHDSAVSTIMNSLT
jgi:hypothetical protein